MSYQSFLFNPSFHTKDACITDITISLMVLVIGIILVISTITSITFIITVIIIIATLFTFTITSNT